jgi:hypothetical protein
MTSYYNNTNKPHCFGNDDYYNETSRQCSGCNYRQSCAIALQEKGKQQEVSEVNYYRPRTATNSTSTSSTTSTTSSSTPSASYTSNYTANNNTSNRPVVMRGSTDDFNFDKPLGRQFATYLAYDIAQVSTERLHSFIVASKENYRTSLKKPENK